MIVFKLHNCDTTLQQETYLLIPLYNKNFGEDCNELPVFIFHIL